MYKLHLLNVHVSKWVTVESNRFFQRWFQSFLALLLWMYRQVFLSLISLLKQTRGVASWLSAEPCFWFIGRKSSIMLLYWLVFIAQTLAPNDITSALIRVFSFIQWRKWWYILIYISVLSLLFVFNVFSGFCFDFHIYHGSASSALPCSQFFFLLSCSFLSSHNFPHLCFFTWASSPR